MTAPFDLFADDPAPPHVGSDLFDEDLFDGPQSQPETSAHVHQEPLEAQSQLAPRHAGNQAGAPQGAMSLENPGDGVDETLIANGTLAGSEVSSAMHLSGHDIRMREFRRALLRGYSRNDVDGFLTDVIKSFDACERTLMNAENPVQTVPARPTAPAPEVSAPRDESAPEQSVLILKHAQQAAAEVIEQAQHSAHQLQAQAQDDADQIVRSANQQAHALHEATLQAARADAERGLLRARDRAGDILQQAADREQQAARIEAEAELRLAHIEQRLAEKAKAVAGQAHQLNSLAAWLAEQDLRPEDPSAHGAPVAHAAAQPTAEGDVLAFRR